MNFFLDNCISPRYARALAVLAEVQGYPIVHLRERFDEQTKDPEWLGVLGREGDWVVVSGDPRITRGKVEQQAWHESGLTAFFFADGWASKSYWKQAQDIVGWWPEIVLEARRAAAGTGFLVPVKGKSLRKIYEP